MTATHITINGTAANDTQIAGIRSDLGVDQVNNTSDDQKPVSVAQAQADALRLLKSANLTDLADAAVARTNLGLGNVANLSPAQLAASGNAVGDALAQVAPLASAAMSLGQFVAPRIVKQFTDLLGITISTSSATVVSTIDLDSPFGCSALKLEITFGNAAGRVEVTPPAIKVPNFAGHLGYTVWTDDCTKIGQYGVFLGDAGYANLQLANWPVFASSADQIPGPRIIYAGPLRQSNLGTNTFAWGGMTAQDHKLRITSSNPVPTSTATVWIKDVWIAQPQTPIVVFSFDDGYDSWVTTALPKFAQYEFKASFGIDWEMIGLGGGITPQNMATLVAASGPGGHHLSSHNLFNFRLLTLGGTGVAKQTGSGTAQDVTAYLTAYRAGRANVEGLGGDPQDMMYHPWVQGGVDAAGIEFLRADGVDVARGTSPYEPMPYGVPALYNSALNLRSVDLSNGRTLAQAKAQIDLAKQYGGLCLFMIHDLQATATTSTQWGISDFQGLVDYVASQNVKVMTMRQVRDKFGALGLLNSRASNNARTRQPVRCIGSRLAANFNSTGDQTIGLIPGNWKVEGFIVTTASVSFAASAAAGGLYTAAAKGGTAIVGAGQLYTGLAATTDVQATAVTPTNASGTLFFSLTVAHGSAANADVFVFGRPA